MQIKGLHTDVVLEAHDYFLVSNEGNGYCITLTDSSRRPLKLCGISRRQWYHLANQMQKLMLRQDEPDLEKIVALKEVMLAPSSRDETENLGVNTGWKQYVTL